MNDEANTPPVQINQPGVGNLDHSVTIQNICLQLIPELRQHPKHIRLLQHIVLFAVRRQRPLPTDLVERLRLQLPSSITFVLLEMLVDALDGVRIEMVEHHCKNFNEYDSIMQNKVERLGRRLADKLRTNIPAQRADQQIVRHERFGQ